MTKMMKSKVESTKSSGFTVKGGSNKMAGQSGAAPAVAGQVSLGGRPGNNTFAVQGGKAKMAGFTGSQSKRPC